MSEIYKDILNGLHEVAKMLNIDISDEYTNEPLAEAIQKNIYEITYIDSNDNSTRAYIEAYSEKQAALVLRKEAKVHRIINIDCIEDHSKDDGEQLSLFERNTIDTHNGQLPKGLIKRLKNIIRGAETYSHNIRYNDIFKQLFNIEDDEEYEIHHYDYNPSNNNLSNLLFLPSDIHKQLHDKEFWSDVIYDYCTKNNKHIPSYKNRDEFIHNISKDMLETIYENTLNSLLEKNKGRIYYLADLRK